MALTPSERFESVEAFRRALALPETKPVTPVKAQAEHSGSGRAAPLWLGATLVGSLLSLGLVIAVFGLAYWAIWGGGFSSILEPTPTPKLTKVASLSTFTVPPTSTLTPSATASTPSPSPTFSPSPTPSSTPTLLPPAATSTPLSPTDTPVPPTDTPTPTPAPTPTPEFPFEAEGVEKRSEQAATMFQGIIRDAAGNPLDNQFVQATCGTYSIISFPSGPVPWGSEKGGGDSALAWAPGYYDINLAANQPCSWTLTLVETDDRQTVKARLSRPLTIEVGPNESPIIVNWRRVD